MASIGHIAVGMAAARVYRAGRPGRIALFSAMLLWSCLSMLPDIDVLGFRFGIRYADSWGHRGATHSLLFAFGLALLLGLLLSPFRLDARRLTLFAAVVLASHALLDTLTDGGLGCALFWPFDLQRYFAPWHPIPVAPIGRRVFSSAGLTVMKRELLLFGPLFVYALWPRMRRAEAQRP